MKCDGCGGDIGNGSIVEAIVVGEISETDDHLTLRFCRANGCARKLLTPGRMKYRVDEGLPLGVTAKKEKI